MTKIWNTDSPGNLIAALPALLGFIPRRSLMALSVEPDGRIGQLLRIDLDQISGQTFTHMRRLLPAAPIVLVIVDAEDGRAGHRQICARFACSALPRGARLSAAFWAEGVEEGTPWRALIGPRSHGAVPDHRGHPCWAASVLGGAVVSTTREGLRQRLAPDATGRARVRRALARMKQARAGRLAAEQDLLGRVQAESQTPIGPAQAARFALALAARETRDRLVVATVRAARGAADVEPLWAERARVLPGRARAEAATLLALACYVRGKGPAAKAALDVALAAEPGHELAELLEACLFAGVRPEALQRLAEG